LYESSDGFKKDLFIENLKILNNERVDREDENGIREMKERMRTQPTAASQEHEQDKVRMMLVRQV